MPKDVTRGFSPGAGSLKYLMVAQLEDWGGDGVSKDEEAGMQYLRKMVFRLMHAF